MSDGLKETPLSSSAQPISSQPVSSQPQTTPSADSRLAFARMALEAGIKSGANWFYWIAGLSLINTISALSGSNWRFLLGLGATEIVNSVAANLGGAGKIAAVIVDAFIAGSFVFFGVFSNKFQKWAFLVGMVLFGLDGLLELLFQSWLSAAFHGYAIYCIYRGYQKLGLLEKLKAFGNVAV